MGMDNIANDRAVKGRPVIRMLPDVAGAATTIQKGTGAAPQWPA
jgi:hypothetical protein